MVDLAQSIALVAARLNDDARAALLELLGDGLYGVVADQARRVDPESPALETYQQQLLAGFDPPARDEPEAAGDDGVEENADEAAAVADNPPETTEDEDRGRAGLVALLALLCATGPKPKAAELLLHLPLHLQGQVIPKLLKTSPLSAASGLLPLHRDLVEALREAMPAREEWGVEPVCQILRTVDSTRQLRRLLTTADDVDHEAVVVLQNQLFEFEDLLRLSDRDIQALLVQVDNHTLGQALLLTDKKVHEGMLRNVSGRRRMLISEEEERWSESTMQEIETAQQQMMALARHLYEQGRITTYFGSVSRTGLAVETFEDEPEEEADDEEEEEEFVEEDRAGHYRGVVFAALGIVVSAGVVWGLVALLATGGERNAAGSSQRSGERTGQGGGGVGVVPSGGVEIDASVEATARSARQSGQTLAVQAVVEVAGQARVEAMGETEIVPLDEEEAVFEMRVGRVRTMVYDEDFEMRTPVVLIKGLVRGALFDTRVVLDATTTVDVVRGSVEVQSLVRDGQRWTLQKGMRGRFDTAGNGRVEKGQ